MNPFSHRKHTFSLCIVIFIMILHVSHTQAYEYIQTKDSLIREINQSEGQAKLDSYYNLLVQLSHYEESIDTIKLHYNNYIEEAKRQGNINEEGLVYTNLLAAYANLEQMDELIASAPQILDFLEKNKLWRLYYQSYSVLLETYFFNNEYQKALRGANEIHEKAKQLNDPHGISAAYYFIALVYTKTNRIAESNEYFRRCIEIQETLGDAKTSLYIQSYYFLFDNMKSYGFNEEKAMQLIKEWERANEIYEENISNQNPVAQSQIYLAYAKIFLERKDYAQTKLYCDSCIMTYPSQTSIGNAAYLQAYMEKGRGNYKEMLEHVDNAYEIFSDFGESDILIDLMKLRLAALLDDKNSEIISLVDTILKEKDSISDLHFHSQLDELRTIYEVDLLEAQKARQKLIIISVSIGSILLLIIALAYILYSRRLKQKNRSLYNQIQEMARVEKEAERTLELIPEAELSQEMKLFKELNNRMNSEQIFLNPTIDRRKIASILGTNEKYLANAIHEGAGTTFAKYISDLRLAYSLQLLSEKNDMTLEIIAEQSGHGSYSAFFTAFVRKYGMGPSDYRKYSSNKQKPNSLIYVEE